MTVTHIACHELRRLFSGSLAWIVLGAVQFIVALFFFVMLSRFLAPAGLAAGRGLTGSVVAGTFQLTAVILLLVAPFLTMRVFSEEHRLGTLQLLLSAPISLTAVVLGKFLSLLAFLLAVLAVITLMPLALMFGTSLDLGQVAAGFLGLMLLLSSFVAIGMFISSLTAQPAVAAAGGFAALFILWILHVAGQGGSDRIAAVFTYLSLMRHLQWLIDGLVRSADVIYFVLLSVLFLGLSIWRLDSLRATP
jgi:ABC-2 type transport system permease protein